jgi:NAD+ synthase (glutamine-hydrolysing)
MTLANQQNALILATGNKSEIAVGYNTLYGDTVGALAPIADLYKTQVYDLAKEMRERIPERIVNKPPSAELRPGQRDQDDLPPYPLLDAILHELVENNASRNDLIAQGFPEAVVSDILCRYYQSEYKRNQLPPAIKVSKKTFGMGRRMPITHAYRN